jgi:hypothetical protein
MTQARAWQLNYQVKLFLIVHTNLSPDEMLLNYGDQWFILRNMEHEEEGETATTTQEVHKLPFYS